MKLITKLSIRNFRSNRRLDIDIDPHVTCITGRSYSGKSNVLRALRWVALNRPSGNGILRWGSKTCRVTVKTKKHTLTRMRSDHINVYNVDGKILKAFGNDIPAPVSRLLHLSGINFQLQQEIPHGEGPLFWFALPPGQVSKRLNQIVCLDAIDRALSYVQRIAREARLLVKINQDQKQEAKQALYEYNFFPEMETDWERLRADHRKTQETYASIDALSTLLDTIEQRQGIILQEHRHTVQAKQDLKELRRQAVYIDNTRGMIAILERILQDIEQRQQEIDAESIECTDAQKAYQQAMKGRCPLCQSLLPKS